MITAASWRGRRYAVLGLARSGRATVDALLAAGAEVVAWDERQQARDTLQASSLEGKGPTSSPSPEGEGVLAFADPLTLDLTGFAGIVVSPGVPLNRHPIAAHAARHGVPVIGDVELFAQARSDLPPHRVVGITGTNGKSTTTALIHHILVTAGIPARLGGNIGLPVLGQEPLPAGGVYVLELSSFQIDLAHSLDCDVAVLTNITPDHLDRYDGFAAYAAAKERLFAMQRGKGLAVIAIDDDASAAIADRVTGAVVRVAAGFCMDQSGWPALQGPHNAQNAILAMAAARELGADEAAIQRALTTFKGLPHRMEQVATRDGVRFVNDSKATNAEAAAPALASFERIHWILGGQAKTADLDACLPHLGHVAAAYVIGEAGPVFGKLLAARGVSVTPSRTLEQAFRDAVAATGPGDTVLLAPAAASFDQFRDFEDRGDRFRALVEAL